ncbi:MAG: hypothetical protein KAH56_08475 [Candidatus Krumholzibacteria bacterium]|nr:hypothetical protein [Candidatus Krumholzibacteria bacterium]
MKKFVTTERMLDVVGVFLTAVLPLLIFLKHSDYSLHAPETLIIFGLILIFALVCGLLMIPGGTPARIIIFAWLAVLIVDVQTDWITTLGLRLLLNSIFFGVLFWFLRRRLTRLVVIMVGLMVLVTVLLPGEETVIKTGEPGPRAGDNPDLPFVLHLVLDEHIGVEGIPIEFDPEGEAAAELRDFYLDQSFAVYGRAYSRYYSTCESLTNMLNFASVGVPAHFLGGVSKPGIIFENNPWFDLLHDQGYRIHVMECDYLRFFDPGETGVNPYGDTRIAYTGTLKPVETANLTLSQKIPFILSTYFTRSYFLKFVGSAYTDLSFSNLGGTMGLPRWDLHGNYPGPLATLQAMDLFTDQLCQAGPGQAFFAHILLPHSPYGLDRDCHPELQPGKWLSSGDKWLVSRTNTPESRALRYSVYLDQMFCLQSHLDAMFQILKDKGLWERAIVIIHGDHGSRICLWPPIPSMKDKLAPSDYLDCFSTLFAVKGPDIEKGYHRQLLPLDHLFGRLFRDGLPPDDPELENNPWVYLQDMKIRMEKQPMPKFAHGGILEGAP